MNRDKLVFFKARRWKIREKTLQEAKNISEKLKTDSKVSCFLKKKIHKRLLKKLNIILQQGQFAAETDKSSRTKNKQ